MSGNELVTSGSIQSFDEEKRELYVRVLPWGVAANTARGVETFEKGAFEGLDPMRFILRQRHQDPPTGRGIELEEKDDALFMRFRVAPTAAGDEQLTLVKEGIETGVSVGFEDGDVERTALSSGRFHFLHKKVKADGVLEVSTTYKPAFGAESQVLQVLERTDNVDETQTTETAAAASSTAVTDAQLQEFQQAMLTQLEDIRERQKAMNVLAPEPEQKSALVREVVLNVRELAEVITTNNLGVVPDVLSSEMLGAIATGRPFMNSTRQVPAPAAGLSLLLPKITQRPTVATQAAEKDELSSQATAISTVDFNMITKGGAGDLSMQLIRRSSPEFLGLWLELLGQAYAANSEDGAVDALLATTESAGGTFDPAAPEFGAAFANSVAATGNTLVPDRIWLSTAALVAFMDAKVPSGGGGTPFYPGLGGVSGLLNGGSSELGIQLQPVWVPALDDEAVDLIVGPSRGFLWAEDGTYTLQADVPGKFGRDVGLAGMLWYAPIYPLAFTSYTLPAS
jgi:phage head maturation protease